MRIRTLYFLSYLFKTLSTDLIYTISKFTGRYIYDLQRGDKFINIKMKKKERSYYSRRLICRNRSYSV